MFDLWLKFYDAYADTGAAAFTCRHDGLCRLRCSPAPSYLFMLVPKGFLHRARIRDVFGVSVEAAIQGIGFDDMVRHQQQVSDIVAKDPDVIGYTSSIGQGPGGSSAGMNIGLLYPLERPTCVKPLRGRAPWCDQDHCEDMRPKMAQVPGIRVFMTKTRRRSTSAAPRAPAACISFYVLQDTDTAELYEWAPKLETAMHDLPGIQDVSSDLQLKNPQVMVEMDRDKIATLGRQRPSQVEDGACRPPTARGR